MEIYKYKKVFQPHTKIQIFLDTSVYISGLISDTGASAAILYAAEADAFCLYITPCIFKEVKDVLNRQLKFPLLFRKFQFLINSIQPVSVSVSKNEVKAVCKYCNDLDDAPMLVAALKSEASYFITLDKKSFKKNIYRRPNYLKIATPGEFMRLFRKIIGDSGYFI